MIEIVKSAIAKVSDDQVLLAAFGSMIWNFITNSASGTLIANITGILILFLIIRKVVFSIIADVKKLVRKSPKYDNVDLSDELELTDREL